jgi:hypothetical protein
MWRGGRLADKRIGQAGADKTEVVRAGFACACRLFRNCPQRIQSSALEPLFYQ